MRQHHSISVFLLAFILPAVLSLPGQAFADAQEGAERMEDGTLSYQGKATVQFTQDVRVPFVIKVQEVLVQIGDDVKRGQRMVRYTMEPQDRRRFEESLAQGANELLNIKNQMVSLDHDTAEASNRLQQSQALQTQGVGVGTDVTRRGNEIRDLGNRKALLRAKMADEQNRSSLLREEYATYFGTDGNLGRSLPGELWVTAPSDGTVIDLNFKTQKGAEVPANAAIAQIANLDQVQMNIQVYESEMQTLKVGDIVEVEVPVLDKRKYNGRVAMISWKATDMNVNMPSFYNVLVDVDNPDHSLKPGFKIFVHIKK